MSPRLKKKKPAEQDTFGAEILDALKLDGLDLPVVPLRDNFILPGGVMPILLARSASLDAVNHALYNTFGVVALLLQKDPGIEEVTPDDVYHYGVLAHIKSFNELPNGVSKALVEAFAVVKMSFDAKQEESFLIGSNSVPSFTTFKNEKSVRQKMKHSLELFDEFLELRPDIAQGILQALSVEDHPFFFYYFMLSILPVAASSKQEVLEYTDIHDAAAFVDSILEESLRVIRMRGNIQDEVRQKLQKNQRQFMLKEELRRLQDELGDPFEKEDPEIRLLNDKISAKNFPPNIQEKLDEELERLEMLHQSSPEYSVIRSYIDWFLALPFHEYTQDHLELTKVRRVLNSNHYGLDKVKERILEHVAVLKLADASSAPILCLVGPPGVGKTTLAHSIADALGRNYIRISLGGVRDESEIRGHRRTYIGSMPGRIIQALRRSKSMNPLILLDEIDKMSGDFRGDPASALLEVLDAEQNHEFSDHYMEVGIDLSNVLFLATANVESAIPEPLRDRMEVVRLSGYHSYEKEQILQKHLYPKVCERNGLNTEQFTLAEGVGYKLIREYTREAGVRDLQRFADTLARKRAREVVGKKKFVPQIEESQLKKYLGSAPFRPESLANGKRPGLVTGLAWTPVGGEILHLECTLLSGRGKISLTGTLGDVMKESAHIALTLVRERLLRYGVDPAIVRKTDIHIHVPEGAIPKDGPSAGTGLTLLLLSAFTRQALPGDVAFTGEVSLTGRVRPVGGIPEKVIAAKEAGIKKVFLPIDNIGDLEELPAKARQGVRFNGVDHVDDLIKRFFKKAKKNSVVQNKSNTENTEVQVDF
jgi:ATP-dependent Lon protease